MRTRIDVNENPAVYPDFTKYGDCVWVTEYFDLAHFLLFPLHCCFRATSCQSNNSCYCVCVYDPAEINNKHSKGATDFQTEAIAIHLSTLGSIRFQEIPQNLIYCWEDDTNEVGRNITFQPSSQVHLLSKSLP